MPRRSVAPPSSLLNACGPGNNIHNGGNGGFSAGVPVMDALINDVLINDVLINDVLINDVLINAEARDV
jgi:hypothetical protein